MAVINLEMAALKELAAMTIAVILMMGRAKEVSEQAGEKGNNQVVDRVGDQAKDVGKDSDSQCGETNGSREQDGAENGSTGVNGDAGSVVEGGNDSTSRQQNGSDVGGNTEEDVVDIRDSSRKSLTHFTKPGK